ncbi:MAG TPA: MarR family transcriptional regulator [Mycobacteriales bacterium]|nr:MarR family transcriptional regulator [Mycobacteriales bacterium]
MATYPGEYLDPLREAIGTLLAADRRLRSHEQHRRDEALSNSHLRALFVLTKESEATAGTLAKAADINPASVTAMIDQLESRGLVSRRRNGQDRRQCWISLTDAGREQVEKKERYWQARMTEIFSDVARKDIEAATKVIERAALVMQRLSEDD